MLKLNIDIVFQYIYFITRLYLPSDFNKQKIKKLFECIPFFLPSSKDQQIFYHLIQEHSIVNYYDTTSHIFNYGYMIYEQYHIKKNLKSAEETVAHRSAATLGAACSTLN